MAHTMKRTKGEQLFHTAQHYLVGGVDSPVRAFNYVGGNPLLVRNGRGSKVYDYDGNAYIDYVLSWGSLILGHAYPFVVRSVKRTIDSGLSFGTTNAAEIQLAKAMCDTIPFVQRIRFVNSGTEAVMGAIRLARGHTRRDKILKFAHCYHGHADYLLVKAGSGLATLGLPASAGVPREFTENTIVVPCGDRGAVRRIFKKYGKKIAAVLYEPVGGNYGVIPPDNGFLVYLRELTKKHGTLLIADEVITGFRFHYGSLSQKTGIIPDLICLGKIIGGGLPIGAYGGSEKIMRHLAPLGKVYQASTFSGNPIVMHAGLATLKTLAANEKQVYRHLSECAVRLVDALRRESWDRSVELRVDYFLSMFSLRFKEKKHFRRFYQRMLRQGVFLAPSEFEANFLSFAHTQADIDKTIQAVRFALRDLKRGK